MGPSENDAHIQGVIQLELQQLNYFYKVAKLQSISNAANELDVSEPYLSKSITLLENELGVKLFDRIGRRIYLNEYGKIFLNSVHSIFDNIETGVKNLKKLSDVQLGVINIGLFTYSTFISDCISAFLKSNPFVKFRSISSVDIQRGNGILDFDFFVFSHALGHAGIKSVPIAKERYVVIMRKDYDRKRFSKRKSINLAELKNESFVFQCTNSFYMDRTHAICKNAGFEPKCCCETDNADLKFKFVNSGSAVSMIPEICIRDVHACYPDLIFLNVEGVSCGRTVYFGWQQEKQALPLNVKFKDFALAYYKQHTEK